MLSKSWRACLSIAKTHTSFRYDVLFCESGASIKSTVLIYSNIFADKTVPNTNVSIQASGHALQAMSKGGYSSSKLSNISRITSPNSFYSRSRLAGLLEHCYTVTEIKAQGMLTSVCGSLGNVWPLPWSKNRASS